MLKFIRLVNMAHFFGAISLTFDSKTSTFRNNTFASSRAFKLLKFNYVMLLIWMLFAFIIIIRYYLRGDMEQFHVSWVMYVCGSVIISIFSIHFWLSDDLCQLSNGFLGFLTYLQGTF